MIRTLPNPTQGFTCPPCLSVRRNVHVTHGTLSSRLVFLQCFLQSPCHCCRPNTASPRRPLSIYPGDGGTTLPPNSIFNNVITGLGRPRNTPATRSSHFAHFQTRMHVWNIESPRLMGTTTHVLSQVGARPRSCSAFFVPCTHLLPHTVNSQHDRIQVRLLNTHVSPGPRGKRDTTVTSLANRNILYHRYPVPTYVAPQ